ncbi:hypothetical protein D3C81_2329460 [compost metagenome]
MCLEVIPESRRMYESILDFKDYERSKYRLLEMSSGQKFDYFEFVFKDVDQFVSLFGNRIAGYFW